MEHTAEPSQHPDTMHSAGENEQSGGHSNADDSEQDNSATKKGPGKKPLIILGVVVVLALIAAFVWWFANRNIEDTDDAFTDGNAVTIAPKASGHVVNLNVRDNQQVHKGDLLLTIDQRDYLVLKEQAEADLALAQAQFEQAKTQLDLARVQYPSQLTQAQAQLMSAKASLQNADAEYKRQHAVDPRATSQVNIDTAGSQQNSARATVDSAEAQVKVAAQVPAQLKAIAANVAQREQQVKSAQAKLDQANLNLSYTEVRAPADGWVTRRNIQLGSLVQAGQSLFMLIMPEVWVTANFKESQLRRMRIGNHVKIEVDAYPDLKLEGHVDSIQLGTGSRFSTFPAENATGNFVKIVQRVPVKIVIDKGLDANRPLPLGLSVAPKVDLE